MMLKDSDLWPILSQAIEEDDYMALGVLFDFMAERGDSRAELLLTRWAWQHKTINDKKAIDTLIFEAARNRDEWRYMSSAWTDFMKTGYILQGELYYNHPTQVYCKDGVWRYEGIGIIGQYFNFDDVRRMLVEVRGRANIKFKPDTYLRRFDLEIPYSIFPQLIKK